MVIEPPCTEAGTCGDGGGGGGGTPPSFSHTVDHFSVDAWQSDNYAEMYDDNSGDLLTQCYMSNLDANGNYAFEFSGPSHTLSGPLPNPKGIPLDTDYSIYGMNLHMNSATGVATVTNSNGVTLTSQGNSSGELTVSATIVSGETQSGTVSTLSLFGFPSSGPLSPNCLAEIALILGVSTVGAALAVLMVMAGCADGPFALVTCPLASMVAAALLVFTGQVNNEIIHANPTHCT